MSTAAHPYRLTPARRLAEASADRHVADLVRLVLLTRPGERLHRLDFGGGFSSSVLFEPVDPAGLSLLEIRARGSLEQALGERIELIDLTLAAAGESAVTASVTYRLRPAGQRSTFDVTVGQEQGA